MSSVWEPVPPNGTGLVYKNISLTGNTANIPTTTLYTTPSNAGGLYRVSVSLECTSAGTAGQVSATLGWNNGLTAQSNQTGNLNLTQLGAEVSQEDTIVVPAGQNITYATTVVGATGAPVYTLNLRVEYLG